MFSTKFFQTHPHLPLAGYTSCKTEQVKNINSLAPKNCQDVKPGTGNLCRIYPNTVTDICHLVVPDDLRAKAPVKYAIVSPLGQVFVKEVIREE
jgi:hypothetical protein